METEVVYLGHNNTIDLQLKASSTAVNLASVSKITLTFGDTLVENSSASSGAITWAGASYSTGEVRIKVGSLMSSSSASTYLLSPGHYDATLVVYDASHSSGLIWAKVPIHVKADPEAS